jgi:hypothetical protein
MRYDFRAPSTASLRRSESAAWSTVYASETLRQLDLDRHVPPVDHH